jgi:DNA processing protein
MFTEKQILILKQLPSVGDKTIFKWADSVIQPIDSFDDFKFKVFHFASLQNLAKITNDSFDLAVEKADKIIGDSEKSKITMIGYWNELFPENYKKIKDPPILLHVAGDVSILNNKKTVAIIGTREPSEFGYRSGQRLAEILAKQDFIIVSGLAKGCDTAAHEGCLIGKGKTVAILAHGLDSVYPASNKNLAIEIVRQGGLLISEYQYGQKAFSVNFINRDRLQSGIANATVVVETDIKGGTMHTVGFTEQQGKILACLSHPEKYFSHQKVNGNKMLIDSGRAMAIGSTDDITLLVNKIYEKIGFSNKCAELEYSATLFSLEEYTIDSLETKPKLKEKKKKKSSIKGVKQGIIWE